MGRAYRIFVVSGNRLCKHASWPILHNQNIPLPAPLLPLPRALLLLLLLRAIIVLLHLVVCAFSEALPIPRRQCGLHGHARRVVARPRSLCDLRSERAPHT